MKSSSTMTPVGTGEQSSSSPSPHDQTIAVTSVSQTTVAPVTTAGTGEQSSSSPSHHDQTIAVTSVRQTTVAPVGTGEQSSSSPSPHDQTVAVTSVRQTTVAPVATAGTGEQSSSSPSPHDQTTAVTSVRQTTVAPVGTGEQSSSSVISAYTVMNRKSTIRAMTGKRMWKRISKQLHPKEYRTSSTPTSGDSSFDQPEVSGFFAWATVTTVALIVVILKRLLSQNYCKCHCTAHPEPNQQSNQQPNQQQPFENIPLVTLHTPPSAASTPSSLSFSTPDSAKPLVPEKKFSPVSSHTRSKCVKKTLKMSYK
ncbi:uncharacterized protein LOC130049183 [Ostrea edulis]|uniref:uncharacterized protein LOC130049183 n=1 Tax=Ostrea edulis TaxID=37623 RepID=UPI0024AFB79A|nr:uncharacterized protein LOC130049183 [Ostrea edulis]XP_056002409.1 uncharacterized protein LOC130049183 [Ostrea edulis]